ncbi:MAG: serine/threonine-protein phosphatase [Solobacterium sp.]|nr:serine/threonine-protein phosphatase [Solobacterium sp.]
MKETNAAETKIQRSLQAKVYRAVLMGSLLIGLVALAAGLTTYTYSVADQYIDKAYGLACTAGSMINRTIDAGSVGRNVLEIYRGLDVEEKQKTGTEEYRALFRSATDNPEYWKLIDTIDQFLSNSTVSNLYAAVIDPDTQALVYVCEPNTREGTKYYPGDWEPMEDRVINKFLNCSDPMKRLYDIGFSERNGFRCISGLMISDEPDFPLFVFCEVTLGKLLSGMRQFVFAFTLALAAAIFVLERMMSRRMMRTVVSPINRIAEAAQTYVRDRKDGSTRTDHFSALNIQTGDEIENLGNVMSNMEEDLSEYEHELTVSIANTERYATQMQLAEKIQDGILPKNFDDYKDCPAFDIYASMDPAMEIGGDFYDFYMPDDDHLVMTIADVSGKGIPAALFMMASKIRIEDHMRMDLSPAEVLETVNNDVCENNDGQMFVTVWLAVLEISTGIVRAVNAGHEYPALQGTDGTFRLYKDRHSFVVGGMQDAKYREYEFTLEPGAALFVYTDGVPEATDADKQMFGADRMLEALNAEPYASPEKLLKNVHDAADAFAGEEPQFDDLTMLCVRYYGPGHKKGSMQDAG